MLPETAPDGRLGLRIREVAAAFDVQPETVRQWIITGQLPAARFGKIWFVSPEIVRQRMLGVPLLPERYL
jgi:excisionase family DNA binding protein